MRALYSVRTKVLGHSSIVYKADRIIYIYSTTSLRALQRAKWMKRSLYSEMMKLLSSSEQLGSTRTKWMILPAFFHIKKLIHMYEHIHACMSDKK